VVVLDFYEKTKLQQVPIMLLALTVLVICSIKIWIIWVENY